jgi:putative flippase GtrA
MVEVKLPRKYGLQAFKFLLVGVFNTVIGYLLFALLSFAGIETSLALALTYVLGVLCNFFTTGQFVFGTSHPKFLLRFLLVYIVIYMLNLGLIMIMMRGGVGKLAAQAMLVPLMALLSFGALKSFAFKGA